jgi:hypothetical protein
MATTSACAALITNTGAMATYEGTAATVPTATIKYCNANGTRQRQIRCCMCSVGLLNTYCKVVIGDHFVCAFVPRGHDYKKVLTSQAEPTKRTRHAALHYFSLWVRYIGDCCSMLTSCVSCVLRRRSTSCYVIGVRTIGRQAGRTTAASRERKHGDVSRQRQRGQGGYCAHPTPNRYTYGLNIDILDEGCQCDGGVDKDGEMMLMMLVWRSCSHVCMHL